MNNKPATVTVVKRLREATAGWDGYNSPGPTAAHHVREMVEQLPSFRNSPQTKTENSLRAIEAVLAAKVGDMTKHPVPHVIALPDCDFRDVVTAICHVINVHHGMKFDPHEKKSGHIPIKKIEVTASAHKIEFVSVDELMQSKVEAHLAAHKAEAEMAGTAYAKAKKAKLSNVTSDSPFAIPAKEGGV